MQRERFQRLVLQALDELPSPYRDSLDNIDVIIERRPTRRHLRTAGLTPGEVLFGLYEGIPLTERGGGYSMVLPDKITIFQEPLEVEFPDDTELSEEVRRTVLHELAHYFGMSDEELEALGMD